MSDTLSVTPDNLIEIRDLTVAFNGQTVVNSLSLDIPIGECLALVGESGSGKSVTAHSILQLLPKSGTQTTGSIRYRGQQLIGADDKALRELRGNRIAMIFQEPMTSLNPLHTVSKQIGETLLLHKGLSGKAAQWRILELLELVGIQHPQKRLKAYPHQLSGGQRQRVMIAMALACEPELLIADDGIKKLIQERARVAEIFSAGVEGGRRTLKMDGMEKIMMGLTDIKMVRSVCIK